MRSRRLNILLLGLLGLWFAVVAPGHERGSVGVPGSGRSCHDVAGTLTDARPASCHGEDACCPVESSDSTPAPPSDPAQHCAICKLIGTLDAPAAPLTAPVALGLLDVLARPAPQRVVAVGRLRLPTQRGPPTCI